MTAPTTRPSAGDTATLAADLRRSHAGPVLTAGDDGYEAARHVWNGMIDRRPALIAQPGDAEDVARAISFGRGQGLEIGVKGGGHSVLGQAVPDGGLMIDLANMATVRVDPERRLAHVGGGALLRDLDRASLEHGLATTAGNISHTGVGGLTLGGGMGWLARQLGLTCDNVEAFRLVTADGEPLRVSATENEDLYWALRGGGGNFGVVTEFTFRLHPVDTRVLAVDLFYPLEHAPEALRAWAAWSLEAPRQATPVAWTGVTDWEVLPEEDRGRQTVAIGFNWIGDPEEGRRHIAELRAFRAPVAEAAEEIGYLDLQTGGDEGMRHGVRRYWKSHYLRELSDAAIAAYLSRGNASEAMPYPTGFMQVYQGAIAEVGPDESAFSQRDAVFEFVTIAGWEDPAEDEARMSAYRRYGEAMAPFASGVYVNGLADEGASGLNQAYRERTLARLTALKDRYDPGNVFHRNHNVTPTGR